MNSLPWIRTFFQHLHGLQQKTLAVFVDALLVCQDVCLAETARCAAAQLDGQVRHTLKRLWRFLANPRFCDTAITEGLVIWIWPRIQQWRYIPVSIDWTHNERRYPWCTLAASISLGGRGLPLLMASYRKADYENHLSRNHCEEAFIDRLLSLLPSDPRLVILADRGFARASLLQRLQDKGVAFILRVPRNVRVRSRDYNGLLGDLVVANGEGYSLGPTEYRDKASVELPQLVVAREEQPLGQPDPWFLATNLNARAATVARLYARRMIIEQDFREAKSRLEWNDSRIRKPAHYRRLTTLMTVVLVFAALVGRVTQRRPRLAAKVARRRKGHWDHGCSALGLALLRRDLAELRLLHQVRLPAQPI